MTLILITLLILAIVYFYYRQRKLSSNSTSNSSPNFSPELRPSRTRSTVFELEEDLAQEDLIAEKDAALRAKNEAQQEALALNNRLKNKHQEITRKEAEIERLKQENSQKEIALNAKLKEKNGLITTLQREINQAKSKHTEQLRAINLLFDPQAKDYQSIDFEGLYALLERIAYKDLPGTFPEEKKDD